MTVLKMKFSLIILNWLMYHLYLKRKIILKKKIIDQLAYYHTCQNYSKGFFINKLILSWLQNFLLIYLVLEKKHNAQYSLLKMIETWKKHLDKREKIGIILMDLWRFLTACFDTINNSLLLAKLDAYGFSRTSLELMENYLCNKQQGISINASFSDWTEVIAGVPQGSILGLLLFNIFLNDIFISKQSLFYWKRS